MRERGASIVWAIIALCLLPRLCEAQCQSGFSSTICPAADRIYIADTRLAALRLSDGKIEWQVEIPPAGGYYSGTTATADAVAVFVGYLDTQIYAFEGKTGAPLWHIGASSGQLTSAGPYVVFSDREHWEALTAVGDKTGKRVWHHTGDRPTTGGVVFLASGAGAILTDRFAIDGSSGRILKRWPRAWTVSAAALGEKVALVGTRHAEGKTNKVAAYSLPGYQTLWIRNDPEGRNIQGIAADAGHILVATNPRDVDRLRPGEVRLEMLEATSSKTIWTKNIMSASILAGSVGLAQGMGVFVTWDSPDSAVVQGFDAGSGQLKWTARTEHKLMGDITCAGARCYIDAEPGQVLAFDARTGMQSWYRIPAH